MKTKAVAKYFLSLVALGYWVLPQASAAENPLKNWEFTRSIEIKSDAKQTMALELDGKIYNTALPDLNDLRITNAQGGEEPYTIRTQKGVDKARKLTSKVLSNETKAQETVLVVDLGEKSERFNEIKVLPKQKNFCRKINVEGSADNVKWETIRKGMVIYSLSYKESLKFFSSLTNETYAGYGFGQYSSENLSFRFPEASFRYVRVVVPHDEDKEPIELSDVEIFASESMAAEESEYVGVITKSEIGADGKSVDVIVDLGSKNLPVEEVEVSSSQTNFFRRIEIKSSNDMKEWSAAGSGTIFSILLDENVSTNTAVRFSETKCRYLKITILNEDNKPIKIDSVKARGLKRFAVFIRENGGTYNLWYGNPKAPKVSYDIDQVIGDKSLSDFGKARLAGEVKNKNYEPAKETKPWTEDKPYLLWIVMGVIILGIISLAAQVIKKVDAK